MLNGGLENEINKYIEQCEKLITYHSKMARNAINFHHLLSLVNVFLSAGSILATSLLTIYKSEPENIALCSGLFSFASLIFMRTQAVYNFNILNILHKQISDDHIELCSRFKLLLLEPDPIIFNELVSRFVSIREKNGLPSVRSCKLHYIC